MRFPFSITSLILAAPLLMVGCSYEQSRPPTPEGLALIKSRTGVGTEFTKMEARPMTFPPKANEVSIWDIKVFDMKDKETGERNEWKFFNQLPQNGEGAGTTDVLMRAWIISRDRTVFLPQTPSYKAYGSFVTDWNIPKPGEYSLFVEYQPAVRGKIFPREMSRWDFKAVPGTNDTIKTVSTESSTFRTPAQGITKWSDIGHKLFSSSPETPIGPNVMFDYPKVLKSKSMMGLSFEIQGEGPYTNQEISALSPDGKEFLHIVGQKGQLYFSQKGIWKVWITFQKGPEKFTTSIDLTIN